MHYCKYWFTPISFRISSELTNFQLYLQFAIIAFAAVAYASANPEPEPYSARRSYVRAPTAAAAAAAAASVAKSGYLYEVPSYDIQSSHPGYTLGHDYVHGHGNGYVRGHGNGYAHGHGYY